jgi:hypothetical protein
MPSGTYPTTIEQQDHAKKGSVREKAKSKRKKKWHQVQMELTVQGIHFNPPAILLGHKTSANRGGKYKKKKQDFHHRSLSGINQVKNTNKCIFQSFSTNSFQSKFQSH